MCCGFILPLCAHISVHRPQKQELLRRPHKAAASSLRKPLSFELLERRLTSHFDVSPSQLESRLVIPFFEITEDVYEALSMPQDIFTHMYY